MNCYNMTTKGMNVRQKNQNNRNQKKTALFAALLVIGAATAASVAASGTAFAETVTTATVGRSQYTGPGATGGTVELRTDNKQAQPAFSGGTVHVLRDEAGLQNGAERQMLSMVIRSADGKVIVADGGYSNNSTQLLEQIKSMGGYVDAWLITHPQGDHAGALMDILKNHTNEIDIRNIYYNFFDYNWYKTVDEGESGVVWVLLDEFSKLPQDRVHGGMKRGDSVTLSDQLSFRVLNDPLQTESAYAVNDSGLMYDITLSGKHIIVLGDMGPDAGDTFLKEGVFDGIQADYVQMSHHGQHGVSQAVYQALKPKACIWPTPAWLYDAQPNNAGGFTTYKTRAWIDALGVTENYGTRDGNVTIY